MKLELKDKYKDDKIVLVKYYYNSTPYQNRVEWEDCAIKIEINRRGQLDYYAFNNYVWDTTKNLSLYNNSEIIEEYIEIQSENYDEFTKKHANSDYLQKLPLSINVNGFDGETYSWRYFISLKNAKKIKNIDSAKLKTIEAYAIKDGAEKYDKDDERYDNSSPYNFYFTKYYPLKNVLELANSGITHNQARLRNIAEKI